MGEASRRRWRLYNPGQPAWLTALEIVCVIGSSAIALLTLFGRLPNVYTNIGSAIIAVAWVASALVYRRRGGMWFASLLLAFSLLNFGWSFVVPIPPGPSGPREHNITPGPSGGQRATQTPR